MSNRAVSLRTLACIVPFAVFAAIYLPTAGHGFISDDFEWIVHNRPQSAADFARLLIGQNGFYRPLVAVTFAVNEALFGFAPYWFGVTNVALAALCGVSIYALCRSLGLPRGAGLVAAAIWLLNFHGINMAILWISGRTALLLTLGATAATAALLGGRLIVAAAFLAVALFSKEEAVMLPLITSVFLQLERRYSSSSISLRLWVLSSSALTAAYLAVRSLTGAMTPATAPVYYRFSTDPSTLLRNILEYADRVSTFAILILVIGLIALRPSSMRLDERTKTILVACITWVVGALSLTIWLPVRSSLYACFPSVGTSIAAAALMAAWWEHAPAAHRSRAMLCALVLPIMLLPVHYARARRWVTIAEFSSRALDNLSSLTRDLPEGASVVIYDNRAPRANMASAFGTLLNDAFTLKTGRHIAIWVEPPVPNSDLAGWTRPCPGCVRATFFVQNGAVVAPQRPAP